jgi:formiminotetrahydrofolate cyclodeaminase
MYPELTLQAFLTRLASADPEPGGGAAAALAGATAAALVSMVANLTIGKSQFSAVEPAMRDALTRAEALRETLLSAVDRDSEAFRNVMRAYGLPRATDDEKTARRTAIQNALRAAAQEPAHVVSKCRDVAELSIIVAEGGNPNVRSDAIVAAVLAEAGATSAACNVEINVKMITDAAFNTTVWDAVKADLSATRAARDHVIRITATGV